MNNPYRPLPPLGALIGFEAAARLGSFSLAAEELNMTQSAVSHQIRTLETHLQQPLFLRISRRVELTDAGRDLMVSAQEALETVRLGVRRLDAYSKPGSVVIHMPPAFGALWLAPRLARLRGSHPDVDPWLYTGSHDVDLTESEFDITLTTEAPIGEGFAAATFLREERIALASPGLAADFQNCMGEAP
ncbi:LysR family transcriptional regulator [Leisingera sp. NJS201]|nr:LysR family transcriptional regulator [Leisingera sp. NJS201]QBR37652.1 LysR family transcriptional regulator [Leisingera sp. NJS201]